MNAIAESINEVMAVGSTIGRAVVSACAMSIAVGIFNAYKRKNIARERFEAADRS